MARADSVTRPRPRLELASDAVTYLSPAPLTRKQPIEEQIGRLLLLRDLAYVCCRMVQRSSNIKDITIDLASIEFQTVYSYYRRDMKEDHTPKGEALDNAIDVLLKEHTLAEIFSALAKKAPQVSAPELGTDGAAMTPELLKALPLKKRWAWLQSHYALKPEDSWDAVRPSEPKPEHLRAWADKEMPDRRELGVVFSDMAHLDPAAYRKLRKWLSEKSETAKEELLTFVGFPSRAQLLDRLEKEGRVPRSGQVSSALRRGDPLASGLVKDLQAVRRRRKRRLSGQKFSP